MLSEDQELAALIFAGNSDAEEKFFADYRLWIEKEIRRQGIPSFEIEDISQLVMLSAFEQLRHGKFRGESSLKTWLHKIIHGKVIDYWRKQTGVPVQLTSLTGEHEAAELREITELLPAVRIDYGIVMTVREILSRLPDSLRIILILNRTGGYTIAEIGRALTLTSGQVAKKLYKAEALFRQMLKQDFPEQERLQASPHMSAESSATRLLKRVSLLLRWNLDWRTVCRS